MTQLIDAPQPPAPTKKPFYKKTWFLVLAGLTVIGIIGSAISGGKGGPTSSASSTASDAPSAGAAAAPSDDVAASDDSAAADIAIGQPAADGKFSFVVNGVDCSQTQLGDQYFNTTAQGQFCIVDLTVSNIGDEPQSFFGDNASLFNAQGQKFSSDSEAGMYLENSDSLYEDINPGNTLNSKVIFDVPAGMVPTAIELHDSAFSGGVTVALQ